MAMLIRQFSTLVFKHGMKLSTKDQLVLLQRLTRLIEGGYSLMESLLMLEWDPKLKKASRSISSSLADGERIDKAFEKAHFHQNIISYLYFARKNGDLESMLFHCSQAMEKQLSQYAQFQKTSRYPFILIVFFTVLLYFIKTAVYPAFTQMVLSVSGDTPAVTTYSIFFVDFLFTLSAFMAAAVILFGPVWLSLRSRIPIDRHLKILQRIPVVFGFQRMKTTFLFAIHLGALLKSTVPMKDALIVMQEQNHHPILAHYAMIITENLNRGTNITTILPSLPLFEKELTSIFLKNNNVKELEHDLLIYAEFLTESLEEKWKKLLSWIQPITFCLLAGLIIFVYLSIMMPMFQLINSI